MAKNEGIDNKQFEILKKFFKLNPKPNAKSDDEKIQILKTDIKSDGSIDIIGPEAFPPHIKNLFNYYLSMGYDPNKYTNRIKLWEDMDQLYYNDSLNARATNLIADETVQADTAMQPVFVEAPKKQKEFILEFFDKLGIYNLIRPTAFSVTKYGNAGWVLGMDKSGISEVNIVDIKKLEDRLEFTPYEVEEEMKKNVHFKKYVSFERVKDLVDAMSKKDVTSSTFNTYLLGFQVSGIALPPWRFLHFRNRTEESPFKPFGMPFYIHALSPYKQWDAAMTFQVMARSINFPIEKHTISMPNVPDITEKVQRVRRLINQLDAIGVRQTNKEGRMLGDRIFTIKDTYDFEMISPDVDLGKMDEAEMLREERIIATRLPRSIIDENDGSFGESGLALVQKWKEFARLVFHVQSIILENLTQLVKLHMVLSGKFQLKDIDFILSMPFPESKNDEIISSQNGLIDLANNIFDVLSDRLLNGEQLPSDVIKSILNQLNIYDQKIVDKWIDDTVKSKETTQPDSFEESAKKRWKLLEQKVGKRELKEMVTDIIYEGKQNRLREGKMSGQHYYSSKNKYEDFDASFLRETNKKAIKKLKESESFEEISIEDYKVFKGKK